MQDLELTQVEFSPARYEPMARLMSEHDLHFVQSQPGFRPEMAKKFMRERRRIFRLYLQDLASDFHRLHAHARAIAATLPAENSPLIAILIRQQARFWFEIAAIEMSLSVGWVGNSAARAHALVDALAAMHSEVGALPAASAA